MEEIQIQVATTTGDGVTETPIDSGSSRGDVHREIRIRREIRQEGVMIPVISSVIYSKIGIFKL